MSLVTRSPPPQRCSRVERRHEVPTPPLVGGPAHTSDSRGGTQQELRGEVAEGDHGERIDQFDLATQVRLAASISSGRGSRFLGGRHFTTFAMYTSLLSMSISPRRVSSSWPERPTNGTALLVLLLTWPLANNHHVGVGVSRAEHDVCPRLVQPAQGAPAGDAMRARRGLRWRRTKSWSCAWSDARPARLRRQPRRTPHPRADRCRRRPAHLPRRRPCRRRIECVRAAPLLQGRRGPAPRGA